MRRLALIAALAACGGVTGPRQVQTSFASFDVGSSGFQHVGEDVHVLALASGTPCLDVTWAVQPESSFIELQLKGPVGDLTGVSCSVARKEPCEAFLSVGVPGERPLVHRGLAGTVRIRQDGPSGLVLDIDAVVSKPALDPNSTAGQTEVEGEPLKVTLSPTSCL